MSFGSQTPVNTIITGPLSTVHYPDGNPVSSLYWYEPQYPDVPKIKWINENAYKELSQFKKWVTNAVRRISYKDIIIRAIVRYSRALDSTDFESSFLKLWSIIEQLTNTVGDRYDKTIRRVCFMFEARDYHKQILEHLRRQRNLSVHHSDFSDGAENVLFQAKFYVQELLWFHLSNPFKLKTIEEAGDFLSMTIDRDTIQAQITRAKHALRFLGYTARK